MIYDKCATYLGRYVFPFFSRHWIFQDDRGRVDKITLALGHPQMDPTICPGLDVNIPVPLFHFRVCLYSPRMRDIIGQCTLGET